MSQSPDALGPTDVARVLDGASFPWWVAGGWAMDLFLGIAIRPRKDIDIAVLRRDQAGLRSHLAGWDLRVAIPGTGLVSWSSQQPLDPPVHEVWASPGRGSVTVLEFLLNDASDTDWLYRRDHRVTYPLATLRTSTAGAVPVLPPEIVLLYKSKNPRPGDEIDFEATVERLSRAAAEWLSSALSLIDPHHGWIRDIGRVLRSGGTARHRPTRKHGPPKV
jgi:hypothetical protein